METDAEEKAALEQGFFCIGYLNPELSGQKLSGCRILLEGFEEIDREFLEQVHTRALGLPVTIAETARLRIREMTLSDLPELNRICRENGLPEPDLIFGWDVPPEQRKPNAYPLREIMRQLTLPPSALLMVDDLRHGYTMAKSCGVAFAAAGWAYALAPIETFMRAHCDVYLPSVAALAQYVLPE